MIMLCPAYLPWEILTSMVFAESLVITHLVPFVTLGDLCKDRKIIIGAAIFNKSKREGNPETSRNSKILLEMGFVRY